MSEKPTVQGYLLFAFKAVVHSIRVYVSLYSNLFVVSVELEFL